jgi:hypothetical protein
VFATQVERGYVVTSKNGWLCISFSFVFLFTGVLYDGSKEKNLTFPIVITKVENNIITFKGNGNPYLSDG